MDTESLLLARRLCSYGRRALSKGAGDNGNAARAARVWNNVAGIIGEIARGALRRRNPVGGGPPCAVYSTGSGVFLH